MKKTEIVLPEFEKTAFHCPHCNVYANQRWRTIVDPIIGGGRWKIAFCAHCNKISIWGGYDKVELLYPNVPTIVEEPNEDLSDEVKKLYREAAEIKDKSPRAAAALLRLALQELCKQLGKKGENINSDIAELVKDGLSGHVQKALDAIRIVGNNAVHRMGEIQIDDNIEIVNSLFGIINFIGNQTITRQKEIDEFYNTLPESARVAVTKRDKKSK